VRIRPDEAVFGDLPPSPALHYFAEGLLRVRHDLRIDPLLADHWSCDPDRCRPLLGRNLCCKVETRCRYMEGEECSIHEDKPLDCALFPLDLVRVAGVRLVTTAKNAEFFATGWCRFDRDMLRCFDGVEKGNQSMFEAQRALLERLFTRSEVELMARALRSVET
jgi:hypothetical protein